MDTAAVPELPLRGGDGSRLPEQAVHHRRRVRLSAERRAGYRYLLPPEVGGCPGPRTARGLRFFALLRSVCALRPLHYAIHHSTSCAPIPGADQRFREGLPVGPRLPQRGGEDRPVGNFLDDDPRVIS